MTKKTKGKEQGGKEEINEDRRQNEIKNDLELGEQWKEEQ